MNWPAASPASFVLRVPIEPWICRSPDACVSHRGHRLLLRRASSSRAALSVAMAAKHESEGEDDHDAHENLGDRDG